MLADVVMYENKHAAHAQYAANQDKDGILVQKT